MRATPPWKIIKMRAQAQPTRTNSLTTQNTFKFKCFDIPINFFLLLQLGTNLRNFCFGVWSFGAGSLELGSPQLNATRRDNKIIHRRHLETISISHKKPGQHHYNIPWPPALSSVQIGVLAMKRKCCLAGKLVLVVVVVARDVLSLI